MSGAMNNTATESTFELHSVRPSDRLTHHNLASYGGNYDPISANPPVESLVPRDLSRFIHYDTTSSMGGIQPSRGHSDQAGRYSGNDEDQINSPYIRSENTGYASSGSQDLHVRAAYDSSPGGDSMRPRPSMPQYNSLSSSPPANIGNPASWLLPRPFRHEVTLPLVGETSYEETEETEADLELPSLSSTRSFSQTKGKSRASTPSYLGRGGPDTPTIRSPYFRRDESGPEPCETGTSSPFYDAVNVNPLHHAFSTTARGNMGFSSDSFAGPQLGNPSPQLRFAAARQQQYRGGSMTDTQSHGYPEGHQSTSWNYGIGPPRDHQPASPRLWRTHDTRSEFGYGQSVISGPVTQTMTPNTSPYREYAAEAAGQESANKTTGTPLHGGPTGEPKEQWQPSIRINRPSLDSSAHRGYQDSSILSPLVRPTALENALRPITNLGNDHPRTSPKRAGTETLGFLDLDLSSDSETDAEDIDARRHLDTGRPQHGNKGQIPQYSIEPTDEQDRVVCAISESRSSDMIGVAVINMTVGEVDLFRIVNDDKYRRLAETLWRASTWPQTFVVLKTAVDQHSKSTVTNCLENEFPDADIVPLDREHWNESEGLRLIDRFAWRADIKAIRQDLDRNFYVSCAFSAVRTLPSH